MKKNYIAIHKCILCLFRNVWNWQRNQKSGGCSSHCFGVFFHSRSPPLSSSFTQVILQSCWRQVCQYDRPSCTICSQHWWDIWAWSQAFWSVIMLKMLPHGSLLSRLGYSCTSLLWTWWVAQKQRHAVIEEAATIKNILFIEIQLK